MKTFLKQTTPKGSSSKTNSTGIAFVQDNCQKCCSPVLRGCQSNFMLYTGQQRSKVFLACFSILNSSSSLLTNSRRLTLEYFCAFPDTVAFSCYTISSLVFSFTLYLVRSESPFTFPNRAKVLRLQAYSKKYLITESRISSR